MGTLGPRLVVAGTHSGVGKTTVATGLMAAFVRAGRRVGPAKVGPDFIDPGYHSLAAGRRSRNLDPWMSGPEAVAPLAARAAAGSDLLIVEGVMGLFDGAADGSPSSTADVADLLGAPVLLVVDASSMSGSVAALVHGFANFDPRVALAGVILNRVGSPSHEQMLRSALGPSGMPVVGAIHRDEALRWRDRHLGLVPVVERRHAVADSIDRLAAVVAAGCDLAAIERIACSAAAGSVAELPVPEPVVAAPIPVAVAAGPAFSFTYPDNLEALAAAGADIVEFDPCSAAALPPACRGLLAGGGFPEVYREDLAANAPLLADVRSRVARGLTTWAECGGLLWLADELDGRPMAGAIPARATMGDRLTLGYRTATTRLDTPLGPAGTSLRGHEFHYSTTDPPGELAELVGRHGSSLGGFGGPTMFASYLHANLATRPDLAQSFVHACAATSVGQRSM